MRSLANSRVGPYVGLLAAIALTGCASIPVNTDFERDVPFASFHSFAWRAPASRPAGSTPVWDSEIFGQRVARAVRRTLVARGYRPAAAGSADFIVTYATTQHQRVRGSTLGFGYWTGPLFFDQDIAVQSYEEGTLILDVLDARTGKVVWRGWSSGVIDQNHMGSRTVDEVVAAILKNFPPR